MNKSSYFYLAILWTLIIFIGCSIPGKEIPSLALFEHVDKIVHLVFFIVFSFLWLMALRGTKSLPLFIIFSGIVYGFGLEFYQMKFVIGRCFDVWDGIADSIGAIIGAISWKRFFGNTKIDLEHLK